MVFNIFLQKIATDTLYLLFVAIHKPIPVVWLPPVKIVVEIGDVWFYTLTLLVWHRAHCITELKMYRKYRYPYVLIRIAEP